MTKPFLEFVGKTVELEALTSSFKSMPVIEFTKKDATSAQLLDTCADEFKTENIVAVYKHDGKFVVFSAQDKVKQFLADEKATSLKVRLISKQLFKHLTIRSIPLAWQNSQATKVERQMEEERREEERIAQQSAPFSAPGQRHQNGFRPAFNQGGPRNQRRA